MSKFEKFWRSLSDLDKAKYAESIGGTVKSITNSYFGTKRNTPKKDKMQLMVSGSKGVLGFDDILDHFYR